MTAAASVVIAATAESTKLETILGAPEEIATHHDQMHITQEKVMTPAGVQFTLHHVICKLPACSSWVLLITSSPPLFVTQIESSPKSLMIRLPPL